MALQVNANYTRITGLQMRCSYDYDLAKVSGLNCIIDSCLIYGGEGQNSGLRIEQTDCVVRNCVIRGFTGPTALLISNDYIWAYNNLVFGNSQVGIGWGTVATGAIINCYSGNNTGSDYSGTGAITRTNCYSEDGPASTTTAAWSTETFSNVTSGSEDLHLATYSRLAARGTDLSAASIGAFSTDMNGDSRVGLWDIGPLHAHTRTAYIMPSGGNYSTLASAVSGELSAMPDLVTNQRTLYLHIAGTWSSADTNGSNVLTISGFTTSATYRLIIDTDLSNRFNGVYSTSRYRFSSTAASYIMIINQNYTSLVGIQLINTNTAGNNGSCLQYSGSGDIFDSCYATTSADGIGFDSNHYSAAGTVLAIFVNCVANACYYRGFDFANAGLGAYLYNCSSVANRYTSSAGFRCRSGLIFRNCYAGGNSSDYNSISGCTFTTCYSADGSAGSTAAYSTANFTNVTSGSVDLHLVVSSALIGTGTDLSSDSTYAFNYDAAGTIRSTPWDVGPLRYGVSPIYAYYLTM